MGPLQIAADRSRGIAPVRYGLIVAQLGLILTFAVITAACLDRFSPIDERAHFDYVRTVAEEHRLPIIGQDRVSPEVLALPLDMVSPR